MHLIGDTWLYVAIPANTCDHTYRVFRMLYIVPRPVTVWVCVKSDHKMASVLSLDSIFIQENVIRGHYIFKGLNC